MNTRSVTLFPRLVYARLPTSARRKQMRTAPSPSSFFHSPARFALSFSAVLFPHPLALEGWHSNAPRSSLRLHLTSPLPFFLHIFFFLPSFSRRSPFSWAKAIRGEKPCGTAIAALRGKSFFFHRQVNSIGQEPTPMQLGKIF